MPRNIKLVISYDGTDFSGWQVQKKDRSVQGEIEKVLSDLPGTMSGVTGAGRTDSGVHAAGQVGNFITENTSIPAEKFRDALNSRLPRDIKILESSEVSRSFNARRSALWRQYEYRLIAGTAVPAYYDRYIWLKKKLPSLKLLNDMARVICGTHDFSVFAAAGDASRSKVRIINHAVFITDGPFVLFRINGNAFLWRMVRSLLGTMVTLGNNGGSAADFREILNSGIRRNAGPTAPSRGLFLTAVGYAVE